MTRAAARRWDGHGGPAAGPQVPLR